MVKKKKWTHWDLNPGPSACEADVIPLHHVPDEHNVMITMSCNSREQLSLARFWIWVLDIGHSKFGGARTLEDVNMFVEEACVHLNPIRVT